MFFNDVLRPLTLFGLFVAYRPFQTMLSGTWREQILPCTYILESTD